MNIFDKIIYGTLSESVVNISKDELDPTVFQSSEIKSPILRDSIRVQILRDIDELRKVVPVVNFLMIGSILTKNYDHSTDIDINVQVDPQAIDDISTAEVMYDLKQINGRMAADTTHPINYYITTNEFDDSKADAVYDVMNNKWLKTPKTYEPDIEKWLTRFQDTLQSIDVATGSLRRDLIDIEEMKIIGPKNIKRLKILMKQKLSQIDELLKQLIGTYRNAKMLRNMSFDRFMTPQEIQVYGSHNQLPENILYKLLEKYYYTKFIKKLEQILDEQDELELSDIPKVRKAMGDLWKTS